MIVPIYTARVSSEWGKIPVSPQAWQNLILFVFFNFPIWVYIVLSHFGLICRFLVINIRKSFSFAFFFLITFLVKWIQLCFNMMVYLSYWLAVVPYIFVRHFFFPIHVLQFHLSVLCHFIKRNLVDFFKVQIILCLPYMVSAFFFYST